MYVTNKQLKEEVKKDLETIKESSQFYVDCKKGFKYKVVKVAI